MISVEHLGKRYVISHQRGQHDELRHTVENSLRAPFRWLRGQYKSLHSQRQEFWALKDVSFSVKQGEAVGIIGRNGAGKSTLLKLLSRITEPSTGRIHYKGRVASLLEVGTGFHPDLTGRENIFLNAAILGMPRSEIIRRFDDIIAFSGVEQFVDTTVKRYSSGMYVRLAFAVAAHLDPDILLIDEVLAVGDAAFQKKCLGKMSDVVKEGRTVLFVSHNIAAVASLCSRALLIDGGCVEQSGQPASVIEHYLSKMRMHAGMPVGERKDRRGTGRMRFSNVSFLNERRQRVQTLSCGQDVSIEFNYELPQGAPLDNVAIQIKFAGLFGQPLFACLSSARLGESLTLLPNGSIRCRIPRLPLRSGSYGYSIWCTVDGMLADYVSEAGLVNVVEGDFFGTGKFPARDTGDMLVDHQWSLDIGADNHRTHKENCAIASKTNPMA